MSIIFSYIILFRLEKLEAGAKDKSEFEKWQNDMKQKDMEAELADIERRRLEGKLSHEEAILARQNIIEDNRRLVAEIKEEVIVYSATVEKSLILFILVCVL